MLPPLASSLRGSHCKYKTGYRKKERTSAWESDRPHNSLNRPWPDVSTQGWIPGGCQTFYSYSQLVQRYSRSQGSYSFLLRHPFLSKNKWETWILHIKKAKSRTILKSWLDGNTPSRNPIWVTIWDGTKYHGIHCIRPRKVGRCSSDISSPAADWFWTSHVLHLGSDIPVRIKFSLPFL